MEWLDDIPCPGQACPYYQGNECSESMILQFLLPTVPGVGVWQLDTKSVIGMINVNSCLAMLRQMFGRVSGIPLILSLEPMEVQPGRSEEDGACPAAALPGDYCEHAGSRPKCG